MRKAIALVRATVSSLFAALFAPDPTSAAAIGRMLHRPSTPRDSAGADRVAQDADLLDL